MFDKNEVLKKKEVLEAAIDRKGGCDSSTKIDFYACNCSGSCTGTCDTSCGGRCYGCGKS